MELFNPFIVKKMLKLDLINNIREAKKETKRNIKIEIIKNLIKNLRFITI
jgi:hypothetical protein